MSKLLSRLGFWKSKRKRRKPRKRKRGKRKSPKEEPPRSSQSDAGIEISKPDTPEKCEESVSERKKEKQPVTQSILTTEVLAKKPFAPTPRAAPFVPIREVR